MGESLDKDLGEDFGDGDTVITHLSNALLEKYSVNGPRYTSYPTAPMWSNTFGPNDFEQVLNSRDIETPLALYAHLPFCEHRCLFCGCNVVITQQREQAEKYLGYLFQEIEQQAQCVDTMRPVKQFHWGGGTPTYLSPEQMARLFAHQTEHFTLDKSAEVAIEVDPRVTTVDHLQCLKELGFNRISLGVQDFQAATQDAVKRIQPIDQTQAMVDTCRQLGFSGINFDLIYGLPHQTVDSFAHTVEEVIRLSPDRIALYHFAYVPWIAAHQKAIDENTLPQTQVKFDIFRQAIGKLLEAGYVYIGMDHFAKPDDELTLAQQAGTLHRNFMGYTAHLGSQTPGQPGVELLGQGVSAISCLHNAFVQNVKKLSTYYNAIEAKTLPTHRGMMLSIEDILRREVINSLLCHGHLDFAAFDEAFGIDFGVHFAAALAQLAPMQEDKLLTLTDTGIELTLLGRILSRNVAMAFDAYLDQSPTQASGQRAYSKTV